MGLLPITPIRSFLPWTITRCAVSVLGSNPPRVLNRKKPCSSIWDTINPISSRCAASMTRLPSGLRVPFLRAITFPILSMRTSSTCGDTKETTRSRTGFSKPGAPGISQICLRRETLIILNEGNKLRLNKTTKVFFTKA